MFSWIMFGFNCVVVWLCGVLIDWIEEKWLEERTGRCFISQSRTFVS